MTENERFWLVFVKTGSINSGKKFQPLIIGIYMILAGGAVSLYFYRKLRFFYEIPLWAKRTKITYWEQQFSILSMLIFTTLFFLFSSVTSGVDIYFTFFFVEYICRRK
jgi:hypothetical protein